jgi:beta-phosphoglucomutase-like phosphatase (HAD superfamily)
MPEAAIFDVDGTLVDSVDLHARAWHEAFLKFGHMSVLNRRADRLVKAVIN